MYELSNFDLINDIAKVIDGIEYLKELRSKYFLPVS